MLAVQAESHGHVVFLKLLSPRRQEVRVEQVPERPDVHLYAAEHGGIVVLVLKGVVELRHYAFFGAFVADPAVVNPSR